MSEAARIDLVDRAPLTEKQQNVYESIMQYQRVNGYAPTIREISTVDGESMYPTLHDKNVVIYERHNSEYKAGDIVALDMPNGDVYVKRVIAVAGDTVNIDREKIYVNGEEVTTPQAVGKTEAKSDKITYPLTVEDKQVFVLGDNREVSRDSREIGTVKIKNIKGKIRWSIGIF